MWALGKVHLLAAGHALLAARRRPWAARRLVVGGTARPGTSGAAFCLLDALWLCSLAGGPSLGRWCGSGARSGTVAAPPHVFAPEAAVLPKAGRRGAQQCGAMTAADYYSAQALPCIAADGSIANATGGIGHNGSGSLRSGLGLPAGLALLSSCGAGSNGAASPFSSSDSGVALLPPEDTVTVPAQFTTVYATR